MCVASRTGTNTTQKHIITRFARIFLSSAAPSVARLQAVTPDKKFTFNQLAMSQQPSTQQRLRMNYVLVQYLLVLVLLLVGPSLAFPRREGIMDVWLSLATSGSRKFIQAPKFSLCESAVAKQPSLGETLLMRLNITDLSFDAGGSLRKGTLAPNRNEGILG
ncbi:hypothetical protein PGT21_014549 [Puccinia graminis f. sp. tritici]|uniref:Uncharacterized protein n=1 Tax=Puccinia graminis f. sp. tritici TaxID=56615 RepID=A0A5B0M665_PUCGR|nr:hypothetical protein PGT21_014549 [Puccinia graminis f. sp. tritici]